MGKFTQYLGKFTQFLHNLCNDCVNIKMKQKITHMHRYYASIVILKNKNNELFSGKIAEQFALFT